MVSTAKRLLKEEVRKKRQRYVLAWFLIGFWCLHFVAVSFLSKTQFHPPPSQVVILNYSAIASMVFLGGDEALRIFEKLKTLRVNNGKDQGDEKQGL